MTRQSDPFAHAELAAGRWLDAVAATLGTKDRHHAYRVLRAWLQVVRDRLTVESAAHLGAQLPELLRGVYYEGWSPSRMPDRYEVEEFVQRYAHHAGISPAEVATSVTAVSTALGDLFSPGQLDHAFAQLPHPLRTYLTQPDAHPERQGNGRPDTSARLRRLEQAVELLTQAVTELAHGLEHNPLEEPHEERGAQAARAVHQLLLARNPGD